MVRVIGWDIGGANVKAARLIFESGRATGGRTVRHYFEIWKDTAGLGPLLREVHKELGAADAIAVTMTAELADVFGDRAEGVAFILRAVMEAIPDTPLYAIAADVYLVLGRIGPGEYVCATPDGRGKTAHEALGRLARVVCEDSKGMTPEEIIRMAAYIAEKQVQQITEGMYQVLSRIDRGFRLPVVAVGIGAFLGASCAPRLGLGVGGPPALAGGESPPFSPSAAAAYLLGKRLGRTIRSRIAPIAQTDNTMAMPARVLIGRASPST